MQEYNGVFSLSAKVMVVEGFITNQAQADTILISFSTNEGPSTDTSPVTGCKATITTDDGVVFNLKEAPKGKYYTPSNLRGQIGKSYQLKFTTPDGQSYESSMDKMATTPPIVTAYNFFDPVAIPDPKGTIYKSASKIYVDVQDPANEQNFYLWRYIHWEKQYFCITCEQGILLDDNVTCLKITPRPFQVIPTYDYVCDRDCWDIIYGTSVNVFSDLNSNGNLIKGRLVANIPYYSTVDGALIEIQQLGISSEGYRFFKILELQGTSTGTLTDTPPAAIVGNIKNVNKSTEPVVGFFGAASVKKLRYYVDRKNGSGEITQILGHIPKPEPAAISRPPLAKCLASGTRTPVRPDGWPK